MMNKHRTKYFYFLFISLFFLFFAFISSKKFKKTGIDNNKIRTFQKVLNSKEKILSSVEDKIFSFSKDDTISEIQEKILKNKFLCDNNGLVIMVYQNDSLICWSNNSVSIPNVFKYKNTEKKIYKFSNGYYYVDYKHSGRFNILGLILIKNNYSLKNNYLQNKFQKNFNIPDNVNISLEKNNFNIYSDQGTFLFSLVPGEKEISFSNNQINILVLLYSLFLVSFLLFIVFLCENFRDYFSSKILFLLFFIGDLFIIRFLIFYFKIPSVLYRTFLFESLYSNGILLFNSIGDIFINSLVLLVLTFFLYRNFHIRKNKNRNIKIADYLKIYVVFLLIGIIFYFIIYLQNILIYSADLNLIFFGFSDVPIRNFLYLFFIASFYTFLLFISDLLFSLFSGIYFKFRDYIFIIIILLLSFYFLGNRLYHIPSYILLTFFVFLFLIWIFKKIKKTKIFSITRALVFILFFSILSTYILFIVSDEKVKKNMEDMALNITNVRDGGLESYFFHIEENILSDKELLNMLEIIDYTDNSFEAKFSETILQKYFSNYKNKYNFQITVCDDYRNLEIQPANTVINCNEYFNDIVTNYGEKTISKNLIFLDYGYYNTDYLGCLHYNIADKKSQVSVFIEASLKNIPSGLGYPELLVNKSSDNYVDFSEYSYAIYKNNELLKSVGKYLYYLSFTEYNTNKEKFTFFKLNKYMHLLYEPEENVKIIISKKNRSFLHIAAPFSYNLIFFSLFYLILFFIIHPSLDFFKIKISFRNRLQFWIITIIISSFLIVCTSTILYVKKFNFNKNVDVLSEKTHSILIEVQHKMHDVEALSPEQRDYVYSLLLKFSNVFFSDINIYNLNGELFSSSRQEIFKNGFVSKQMNIIAFNELKKKKKNLFIHKEKIGNYEFLSAYMPFRNDQNKLVAYLNLPYFVKQDDYKKEISAFIVTYVSIYLILIVFAIYITLIISGYITRPLQNLKQKIGQLKLDKHNEKIKWKRQDEIGELINEYNRMIDELSKSAELLAKSEREFAWREMARQVAHEIKNPLTPMKLSVQYLNKAWDERVDDWEEKFKSFSKTIVEQIDSLSDIASSFSDFAKMPKTKNKKIELSSVINSAIDLYKDCSNIEFSFDYIKGKKYYIFADKKQMLRAFNNLIKNSIQAIGKEKHGKIDFVLNENKDRYLIKIIDNGLGIPKDKINKIFIPNFTTKSGGMGLGLAMVKNIIVSAKGEIWFESEENKGTTFYISLPVLNV